LASDVDPQCREVLRRVEAAGDLAALSVAEARALDERLLRELGGPGPAVAEVRDLEFTTAGGTIAARLYRPHDDLAPAVLVWLHGGGFVLGSVAGSDAHARALARASGCAVVSIGYRLAPEHRFPAAPDDCYAATAWVAEHAAELGARPGCLAVGGDSAGGNLAAVTCLLARERRGPRIDAQLLVYPVTARDPDTPSYRAYADGCWLTADAMRWFWGHYLPAHEDGSDPRVSPLRSGSLAGLPPTIVVTAECDVLRDEAEQYAERLRADGVPVRRRRYEGMLHGFLSCGAIVDEAWVALEVMGSDLRAILL
jgi:acetyl esterase